MMKLTARGRYAVNAILEIALNQTQRPLSIAELSYRQGISQSYLEQLFAKLRYNGLVKSVRGPGGGYLINGNLEDISIAQIIVAIEENDLESNSNNITDNYEKQNNEVEKKRSASCKHNQSSLDVFLWEELNQVIFNFLNSVSLAKIVCQTRLD